MKSKTPRTPAPKSKCPICAKLCTVRWGGLTYHGYREIRRGRTNTIQTQPACIGSGTLVGMSAEQIREYEKVSAILWSLCFIANGRLEDRSPWFGRRTVTS
jgi:hypothetical protein